MVVDTDETASRVLDIMMREKNGRVTFMPLNRLKPKIPPLPNAQDAIPLIDKLRFDPKHVKAFQQVFGKTCVCRDLTIAAAYVKSHNINTITLDGDKVDRKGALTGGYHDVRRSRIEAIRNVTTWRAKWAENDARLREVKQTIMTLEQQITRLAGEVQVNAARQAQARAVRESVAEEVATLLRERERQTARIARLEVEIDELQSELSGLDAKIEGFKAELRSPMAQNLTNVEEDLIETLGREVEQRQKALVQLGKEKNEVGSRKNLMEIELNEGLLRRREELRLKIEGLGASEAGDTESGEALEAKTRELRALNNSIESLEKKIAGELTNLLTCHSSLT